MEYKIFQNNLHDAHKITKYCIGICSVQFVMLSLLIILCINLSDRVQTTLLPMNTNTPISISNNAVSANYLNQAALSFINLRLNFDPNTIDQNHQIILRFASSSVYQSLKKSLNREAKLVKSQGISSNFYVSNIKINRHDLSVLVSGRLMRSVGSKPLAPVNTRFLIVFKNNDGLLAISKFVEERNV